MAAGGANIPPKKVPTLSSGNKYIFSILPQKNHKIKTIYAVIINTEIGRMNDLPLILIIKLTS